MDDKLKTLLKEDYEQAAFHPNTSPPIKMSFEEALELTQHISNFEERRRMMKAYAMSDAQDQFPKEVK